MPPTTVEEAVVSLRVNLYRISLQQTLQWRPLVIIRPICQLTANEYAKRSGEARACIVAVTLVFVKNY